MTINYMYVAKQFPLGKWFEIERILVTCQNNVRRNVKQIYV